MNPDATLAALADDPFTDVDLAELSLRLAVDEYPTLDVAEYLRRLDSLTIEVAPRHPRSLGVLASERRGLHVAG